MEQDALLYLDLLKAGIDAEHKTGLLKKLFSFVRLRKSGDPVDLREEALRVLQENAINTLASQELTMSEALQILGPDFAIDDLGKVDPTWEKRWAEGVSRVGIDDKERRTWWARLLAGEIQQPGAYSLRTLAIMDTLSTREAELFVNLCGYVWILPMREDPGSASDSVPTIITPPEGSLLWMPHVGELRCLEDAGLAHDNTFDYRMENIAACTLTFHGEVFMLRSDLPITLRFGRLMLTGAGKEIYQLVTPERSQLYLDEILAEWQQQSWVVIRPFADAQ